MVGRKKEEERRRKKKKEEEEEERKNTSENNGIPSSVWRTKSVRRTQQGRTNLQQDHLVLNGHLSFLKEFEHIG